MGRKLVLVGTKITDQTAPLIAEVDTILPAAGALMYINPAHEYAPWGAGIPGQYEYLPNLAATQASAATGLVGGAVDAFFKLSDPAMIVPPRMIVERTAKGGLHWIGSPTYDTTGNHGVRIYAGTDLLNWIKTNKSHSFYVAKWGRITRPVSLSMTTGGYNHTQLDTSNQGASMFYRRSTDGTQVIYPAANLIGSESVNANSTSDSPVFQDAAWSNLSGMNTMVGELARFIRAATVTGNYAPAIVFYGYYLEDLTISGRTYSQVHEVVKARYTSDVLTVGGRYYGDIYTDPATLA